jgi:hypothetical protein
LSEELPVFFRDCKDTVVHVLCQTFSRFFYSQLPLPQLTIPLSQPAFFPKRAAKISPSHFLPNKFCQRISQYAEMQSGRGFQEKEFSSEEITRYSYPPICIIKENTPPDTPLS